MIAEDKVVETFCVMDGFVKNLHAGLQKSLRLEASDNGTRHRNRRGRLCEGEIMMIPVRHNSMRCSDKVFKDIAMDGFTTSSPTSLYNDCGEVMTFCLTRANADSRDARAWNVSVKEFHGKVFADRGY